LRDVIPLVVQLAARRAGVILFVRHPHRWRLLPAHALL